VKTTALFCGRKICLNGGENWGWKILAKIKERRPIDGLSLILGLVRPFRVHSVGLVFWAVFWAAAFLLLFGVFFGKAKKMF